VKHWQPAALSFAAALLATVLGLAVSRLFEQQDVHMNRFHQLELGRLSFVQRLETIEKEVTRLRDHEHGEPADPGWRNP